MRSPPFDYSDVPLIPILEDASVPARINLPTSFTSVMNTFRGLLHTGERSARGLALSTRAISLNAANYTAWSYRRECLEAAVRRGEGVARVLSRELLFTEATAARTAKNYQLWQHRRGLTAIMLHSRLAGGGACRGCAAACREALARELVLTAAVLCGGVEGAGGGGSAGCPAEVAGGIPALEGTSAAALGAETGAVAQWAAAMAAAEAARAAMAALGSRGTRGRGAGGADGSAGSGEPAAADIDEEGEQEGTDAEEEEEDRCAILRMDGDQVDSKNYHAWAHRQWALAALARRCGGGGCSCDAPLSTVVPRAPDAPAGWAWPPAIVAHELAFARGLLREDVRNNSAWSHRFLALAAVGSGGGGDGSACGADASGGPHDASGGTADARGGVGDSRSHSSPRLALLLSEAMATLEALAAGPTANDAAWAFLRGVLREARALGGEEALRGWAGRARLAALLRDLAERESSPEGARRTACEVARELGVDV